MYDPHRQYRCTIIRGKSQKEMDDLLPAYVISFSSEHKNSLKMVSLFKYSESFR